MCACLCLSGSPFTPGQAPAALIDINPGSGSSAPRGFVTSGGLVFFLADDGVAGEELWRTDGSAPGTFRVADIRPGSASAFDPNSVIATHGKILSPFAGGVLFAADDGISGTELWFSDGSPTGTFLVRDIRPGPSSSDPRFIEGLSGTQALFAADDGVNGMELWTTDGTLGGTSLLIDIRPGSTLFLPFSSAPRELRLIPGTGRIIFQATDDLVGTEPWATDGTAGGTTNLGDLFPGNGPPFFQPNGSFPRDFTAASGLAFFSATDGGFGRELWATDLAGFVTRLADINPGPASSDPGEFSLVGNDLYFAATDGTNDREPWIFQAGNAARLADLVPGPASSAPTHFLAAATGAIFVAGPPSDRQLWGSDGSTTLPLSALPLNSFGLNPTALMTGPGGALFLTRNQSGNLDRAELWRVGAGSPTPIGAAGTGSSAQILEVLNGNRGAFLGSTLVFAGADVNGVEPFVVDVGQIPGASSRLGVGCGPQPVSPTLASNRPVIGQNLVVSIDNVTPSSVGDIYVRFGAPGFLPLPGAPCAVFVDVAPLMPFIPVVSDGTGSASFTLGIPGTPALAGFTLTAQGAFFGTASAPFGVDITCGLLLVIGF